jgi:hypothetical protein
VRELRVEDTELDLIIHGLKADRVGKWGDDRHKRLIALIAKLERARVSK